jgi:hypothetical protein
MNGYIGQNTKNVEEYIEHIRGRIIAAANNWKEIAAAFAEAKEMYGFDSDTFKRLCNATKFSKSTASKLATVATSERLKKHEKELAAVHSWTVLYAITTLNDDQFERLLKNKSNKITDCGKAEIITMGMVKAARQIVTERSVMRVYARVMVDVEAIRTQMMDSDSIAALEAALKEIQINGQYVKIEMANVMERENDVYLSALSQAFKIESRSAFMEEINKSLGRRKKAAHESKEQFEKRALGQSKASFIEDFEQDAEQAFMTLVGEYDAASLWDRAHERVSRNQKKVVERVKSRGDAFVYANAAIKEIKEKEEAEIADLKEYYEMSSKGKGKHRKIDTSKFAEFK